MIEGANVSEVEGIRVGLVIMAIVGILVFVATCLRDLFIVQLGTGVVVRKYKKEEVAPLFGSWYGENPPRLVLVNYVVICNDAGVEAEYGFCQSLDKFIVKGERIDFKHWMCHIEDVLVQNTEKEPALCESMQQA